MSEGVHKGVIFPCAAGTGTGTTVCELGSADALNYDTWILGSAAGVMDVLVSVDGSNYLTTVLTLLDMNSTTPSTMVAATVANGTYAFRGKFGKIKLRQLGATAVTGASLIGYRTA